MQNLLRKFKLEKLIFNVTSKTLIAALRPHKSDLRCAYIYCRQLEDADYKQIQFKQSADCSLEFPVTASKSSAIYFLVWRHSANSNGVSGNWVELRMYDLKSKRSRVLVAESAFSKSLKAERAWVSELFSVGLDDEFLFCRVGIQGGTSVRYYFCQLCLKTLDVTKLTELNEVFY